MGIKELWGHIIGTPFGNNFFEISILYTLIIIFVISCILYFFKRKNIEFILFMTTYLIFVSEWLFLPILLNGNGIDGKMFIFNFDFISAFEITPLHMIGHLLLLIPLGCYISSFFENKRYVILSSVSIVVFIEVIRVIINYMTHYIQFRVEGMDMILHFIGMTIGVMIYYIYKSTWFTKLLHIFNDY